MIVNTKNKMYFLHLVIALITPTLFAVILIYFTDNIPIGVIYGFPIALYGYLFLNFHYSFIYFKFKFFISMLLSVVNIIISILFTSLLLVLFKIDFEGWYFPIFGYLVAPIFFTISSILSWELIDKYLPKRELSSLDETTSSL